MWITYDDYGVTNNDKKEKGYIDIKSLCAFINTRGADTQAKHVFKTGSFRIFYSKTILMNVIKYLM